MRQLLRYLLPMLLIFGLIACESDEPPAPTGTPPLSVSPTMTSQILPTTAPTRMPTRVPLPRTVAENPAEQSYLRFVHAAPTLSRVNFDINGAMLAAGMTYTRFTQPTPIVAGGYTVRVMLSEVVTDAPALLVESIDLLPGQTLVLVLTGSMDAPVLTVVPEPVQPMQSGEGTVRLFNALDGDQSVLISAQDRILSGPIEPLTAGDAVPVQAGTITLTIQIDDMRTTYVEDVRSLRRYTLVLTGSTDDSATWQVIAFDRRVAAEAQVRVIHAAPDVGAVDVYLGDVLLASGLTSYAISERQAVAGQSQNASVYVAGELPGQNTPLMTEQFNIRDDDVHTIILTGTAETLRFTSVVEDTSTLDAGRSRLTFVHVVPDVPRVEYSILNQEITPPLLDYRQSSEPLEFNAGEFDLVFTGIDGSEDVGDIEYAEGVRFESGRSYLYLITGLSPDMPPVVYSEEVGFSGVDEAVIGSDRVTEEDVDSIGIARLRLVNAIDGSSGVNFWVDDHLVAEDVTFGEGASFVSVTEGEHTISLRDPESSDDLYSELLTFAGDMDYSVYAHGFSGETLFDFVQITDNLVAANDMSVTVRMVNLSFDSYNEFALGFVVSAGGPVAQPFVRDDGSIGRPSLFAEVNQIISAIEGGTASVTAAIVPGNVEFHVIEPVENVLALGLGPVTLEAGLVYDVVVYQYMDSLLLNGFVIAYPGANTR